MIRRLRDPLVLTALVSIAVVLLAHASRLAHLWDAPVVASRVRDLLEYDMEEMRRRAEVTGDWVMLAQGEAQGLGLPPGGSGSVVYRVEKKPEQSVLASLLMYLPHDVRNRVEISGDDERWETVFENTALSNMPIDLDDVGQGSDAVWIRISASRDSASPGPITVLLEQIEIDTFDARARLPDLPTIVTLAILPVAVFVAASAAGASATAAAVAAMAFLALSLAASFLAPDLVRAEASFQKLRLSAGVALHFAIVAVGLLAAFRRNALDAWRRPLERLALAGIMGLALLIRWRLLEETAHLRLDPDAETVYVTAVEMSHPYDTGWREPLWVWMVKGFLAVFGESELRLRYYSLTFSMVVIYAAYRLFRDYTKKPGMALLAAFILAIHSLFIAGSFRGLRTEMQTVTFLVLSYFVFVRGLPVKRRIAGLTAGVTLTTLTALSALSAQGLLVLYAWWRHKLPFRAVVIPFVVAGTLVSGHLLDNKKTAGDPFFTVNMYGTWWRNYEFVMIDGVGCDGCPTREEFQKESLSGTRVTLTHYIFAMHPPEEVVRRVAHGYRELFLKPGQLRSSFIGTKIRAVHLVYLVGLVMVVFSPWRELLLMPLLSLNLVAFTIRLGIDARMVAHLVPLGSTLALCVPLWLMVQLAMSAIQSITEPKPDLPKLEPKPPGSRFTKEDRIAWSDATAEVRDRYKRINRYYHAELERFFTFVIPPGARVLEIGCSTGDLLAAVKPSYGVGIDIGSKVLEIARQKYPHLVFKQADIEELPKELEEKFDYIILSDTVGELEDVLKAFESLGPLCTPETRIVISYYNYLWEPVLKAGERLGRKMPQRLQSWLSTADIEGFLALAGFETVRRGSRTLLPRNVPGVSWLANRVLAGLPGIRNLNLVEYLIARPAVAVRKADPVVTVVVPTRNEAGNIEGAVTRIPKLGRHTEILFVDGSSTDGTVEKIEEMIAKYRGEKDIKLIHQVPRTRTEAEAVAQGLINAPGKMLKLGKGDAVRKGFDAAAGDIVLILDADLTVPPEDLPKFVNALAQNRGEFVNGTRLVYPMEKQAMRFLNLVANKGFSVLFTWLLEQRIKDTLCGTKALWKADYRRIVAGRHVFGDFDPFGDFDLLFGAARLGLKIVEIPIRYRERVYGDVKIERFKHGVLLLRMCGVAYRKLKTI